MSYRTVKFIYLECSLSFWSWTFFQQKSRSFSCCPPFTFTTLVHLCTSFFSFPVWRQNVEMCDSELQEFNPCQDIEAQSGRVALSSGLILQRSAVNDMTNIDGFVTILVVSYHHLGSQSEAKADWPNCFKSKLSAWKCILQHHKQRSYGNLFARPARLATSLFFGCGIAGTVSSGRILSTALSRQGFGDVKPALLAMLFWSGARLLEKSKHIFSNQIYCSRDLGSWWILWVLLL